MSPIVLLDAGPLGLVTNPKASPVADQCNRWLEALLVQGTRVLIPEIADYEVRRELLRAGKARGVAQLDQFKLALGYLPLTTETMLQAAAFWAQARRQGQPTADDKALDADVILAAQAATLGHVGEPVVIATTNVGHLARFTLARYWHDIHPEP